MTFNATSLDMPLDGPGPGEVEREWALNEDATPRMTFDDFEGGVTGVVFGCTIAPRSAITISSEGTCQVAFYGGHTSAWWIRNRKGCSPQPCQRRLFPRFHVGHSSSFWKSCEVVAEAPLIGSPLYYLSKWNRIAIPWLIALGRKKTALTARERKCWCSFTATILHVPGHNSNESDQVDKINRARCVRAKCPGLTDRRKTDRTKGNNVLNHTEGLCLRL